MIHTTIRVVVMVSLSSHSRHCVPVPVQLSFPGTACVDKTRSAPPHTFYAIDKTYYISMEE